MYQFSDSDSTDSEDGIRFKTDSTRNKVKNRSHEKRSHESRCYEDDFIRDRHYTRHRRSHSPYYRKDEYRRNRDARRDRSLSRSRSPKYKSKQCCRHEKGGRKVEDKICAERNTSSRNERCDRETAQPHSHRNKCDELEYSHSNRIKDVEEQVSESVSKEGYISFGPALPPHLVKNSLTNMTVGESKEVPVIKNKSVSNLGTLQQNNAETNESDVFGPKLPKHLLSSRKLESFENKTHIDHSLNPTLPCSTQSAEMSNVTNDCTVIGPALPPQLSNTCDRESYGLNEGDKAECIGPVIPLHLREKLADSAVQMNDSEEDDTDTYGPVPPGSGNRSDAHIALEERALQMKINQLGPRVDAKPSREEWMLELPQVHASNLGLGPRQFRPNPAPDLSDRSSWTDTPEDKAKKSTMKAETKYDMKKEAELKELERRDKQQEEVIKSHKKKRKEKSLLEIHQDKLKAKKQEGEEASVRRPFSREIDLKVNRFDETQKKAILKKAQLLDDRFSQGQSKFL